MFCSACGEAIVSGAIFCGRCGSPAAQQPPAMRTTAVAPVVRGANRQSRDSVASKRVAKAIVAGIVLVMLWGFSRVIREEGAVRQPPAVPDVTLADQASFSNMTASRHLAAAQAAAKPDAAADQIDEALRHLKAIPPSSAEAANARALEHKLTALRAKRQEESAKVEAEDKRDREVLELKAKRILRDQMAKDIENTMLDQSYNVDVNAIGTDHTVLHLKWVLVSKAMAHQLSERSDFFENARAIGFKRIEITDGYDQTWRWNLQ
jgi:hypothetical protein